MSLEKDIKVIEEILRVLRKGPLSWTQLFKKTNASPSQFVRVLNFLRDYNYIQKKGPRGSREPYELTGWGLKFSESLPQFVRLPLTEQIREIFGVVKRRV